MTISQLNQRYNFSRKDIVKKSGVSYPTVINFFRGKAMTVATTVSIINSLPITPQERQELINSYFEPKE